MITITKEQLIEEQLIEDLKASTQNASGMFEISEDTICALMSMLTSAALQLPYPAPEVTADDCPAFIKYDVTDVAEAWSLGHNQCRAAMLHGNSDGNSPVIPDGWQLVPKEPTKDMLRAGQSVVGFWLNTVHCYSKMLATAPAVPQQEVKK